MIKLVLPHLRPYQTDLVRDPAREICCISSTQIGKTFAYAVKILAAMWQYKGLHIWWWIAPTYKQTIPGQRVLFQLATSSGIYVSGPKPPFRTNPPPPLTLINGVSLDFRTWDNPENLMGDPIAGGVVDEAGLLTPHAHSSISSRRSETLGPLWCIGNPGMYGGPFRALCSAAEADTTGSRSFHRWTWKDKYEHFLNVSPAKAKEYHDFIEQERDTLPEYEFRRLYEAEWTSDEAAVFKDIPAADGPPLAEPNPNDQYDVGVDVAQEVDYMVAAGIGRHSGRVDFMERWRGIPYPQAADRLQQIQAKWRARMAIETNGPGIAIFQELQKRGVPVIPWQTTGQSKQDAVMQLATDLSRSDGQRLKLAQLPPLHTELEVFRYIRLPSGTYRYSAPDGMHDDTVIAVALANWLRRRTGTLEMGWVA